MLVQLPIRCLNAAAGIAQCGAFGAISSPGMLHSSTSVGGSTKYRAHVRAAWGGYTTRMRIAGLLAAVGLLLSSQLHAQEFPNKLVRRGLFRKRMNIAENRRSAIFLAWMTFYLLMALRGQVQAKA